MTKRKTRKEHVYFSGINKDKERFEVIESSIGFSHSKFRLAVKDELRFIGLEISELAKSIYVDSERLGRYLRGSDNLSTTEIQRIQKRLGM
jgi:hypothetical protein